MTTPKTSHHSALSELMVQNVELRAENANMKNDLVLWAKYFDKQWPKDVHETIERLKVENQALKARLDKTPYEVRVFTPTDRMYMAQLTDPLNSEIERLKAENARLKSIIEKARAFPASIGTMDSIALVGVLSILEGAENE